MGKKTGLTSRGNRTQNLGKCGPMLYLDVDVPAGAVAHEVGRDAEVGAAMLPPDRWKRNSKPGSSSVGQRIARRSSGPRINIWSWQGAILRDHKLML